MKVNVRSIGFRLLVICLCAVLFPLRVVGGVSISKSSRALTAASKEKVQTIAQDTANLVHNILNRAAVFPLNDF